MIRARIASVLLTAVACMIVVPPAQSFAGKPKHLHPATTQTLIEIRESAVREIRKDAAHSIKDINHQADEAVKKILKHEGKKNDDKKDAKEAAKAAEKITKESARGVREILKTRDGAIRKLTERGAPQRFKGRVWRVANRRMAAVQRNANAAIARVNAAAN